MDLLYWVCAGLLVFAGIYRINQGILRSFLFLGIISGAFLTYLTIKPLFEKICDKYQLKLLIQKQFKELRKYGFDISEDVANRKADFILLDDKKKAAINFEVNFYNDTGSKPEEIIDSYINRQNDLKSAGIDFALVTDGKCWITASNQLSKGFRHLNFLLNFYMLKHGMLEEIVNYVFKIEND